MIYKPINIQIMIFQTIYAVLLKEKRKQKFACNLFSKKIRNDLNFVQFYYYLPWVKSLNL